MNELTVRQAAEQCGISRQAVLKACQTGRLKARQSGEPDVTPPHCRAWIIRADDLAEWRRTAGTRRGRPRKEQPE